jgi:hypothetical protein
MRENPLYTLRLLGPDGGLQHGRCGSLGGSSLARLATGVCPRVPRITTVPKQTEKRKRFRSGCHNHRGRKSFIPVGHPRLVCLEALDVTCLRFSLAPFSSSSSSSSPAVASLKPKPRLATPQEKSLNRSRPLKAVGKCDE